MDALLETLLSSEEPAIRYKIRAKVLCEPPGSPGLLEAQCQVKDSPRVQTLLAECDDQSRKVEPGHPNHPYKKWRGAHWVFATLADIGYPAGDVGLIPLRDQVLDYWLRPEFCEEFVADHTGTSYRRKGVPVIQGRARRCASQQGNALFSALSLGLLDERCERLAALLMRWQWPDGGWNCDLNPEADSSSFWESLIPLRALALYANVTADPRAAEAASAASEVFLKRRLFRRISDGQVMNAEFLSLHYPCYWHYDLLFALKVMAEAGFIRDPRCAEALDILEGKRLPGSGWPAEYAYYTLRADSSASECVSWGGASRKKMNEWVTADALFALRAAGRLEVA